MVNRLVDKPELLTADGKPVPGSCLDIPPEGLELSLSMPKRSELESAILLLHTTAESEAPLTCDFTSDKGPITGAFKHTKVSWLIADWHTERPVNALEITPAGDTKIRVKYFQNEVWLPLTPVDIMAIGSKQHFSPVVTSKLMVEFVTPSKTPGLWDPAPMAAQESKVYASLTPYDLALAVADGEPFFLQQGALRGSDPIAVTGFKEAINNYVAETGDTDIPLKITARMPAKIEVKTFETTTISVLRALEGVGDEGRMILPWSAEAAAGVTIGENAEVKHVQFEFTYDLLPERLLVTPGSIETSRASLVDAEYGAAQGFAAQPDGTTLNGVDLYMRPARLPVKAVLDLCPDEMGRPAAQSFPGASSEVELNEAGNGPPKPRWVAFQLSKPFAFLTDSWWAVLRVVEGEIHWLLAEEAPEGALGSMYRVAEGPWLQRLTPDGVQVMWGLTRLRSPLQEKAVPSVSLRRGKQTLPLKPDPQGRVHVAEAFLLPLNPESAAAGKTLELVITGESTGNVVISKPCIRFKPKMPKES